MVNAAIAMDRPVSGQDQTTLHRRLAHWNKSRLAPGFPVEDWEAGAREDFRMQLIERAAIEQSRRKVVHIAAAVPRQADAFVEWYSNLRVLGPGQGDPLFPWLAQQADLTAMRWFVQQEAAGEAGFDDLVAMAQVKMPVQAKLELARNYWDEMGRGARKGMHGPMLSALADALDVNADIDHTVWPSLALANTMAAFATNRCYAFHAIGALGVIELTAPGRATHVAAGLKRLGVPASARHYFELHAVLDVRHSEAWNREVVHSLVDADPDCAPFIAEGALMRLHCGARCFDVYRKALWSSAAQVAPTL